MAKLIVITREELTIDAEKHKETLMKNPDIARILNEIETKKSQKKNEEC